jgi:hypothetical protein
MTDPLPNQPVLPVMPETARRVRSLLGDPRSTNADIELVVQYDPGAVLALYGVVEAARPGAAEEIGGPAHALSLLGRETFQRVFGQLPELDGHRVEHILSPAFAYGQAAHAGWYACEIGRLQGLHNSTELRVAAMLQHPAILALWHADFDAAARASSARRGGAALAQAFDAALQEPLQQMDGRLAREWRLPRLAREATGAHDPANRQLQILRLAGRMAEIAYAGWPAAEALQCAETLAGLLPRERDAHNWWHRQTVEAAHAMQTFGYPLPACELPLIPAGAEEARPGARPQTRPEPAAEAVPEPAAAPQAGDGLQALVNNALRELAQETGSRRVIFALLSHDRKRLRTRMVLGTPKTGSLRNMDLGMREKHLFSLLLQRRQAVKVSPGNAHKYAPYLQSLPLDAQAREGFYAISLFVRDRPVGILYADGGPPDDRSYALFRHHADEVMLLLGSRQERAA